MENGKSSGEDHVQKFSSVEVEEAKKLGEFFIDILDNHRENFRFYLADTAVLDWFGRTVRGHNNIHSHIFDKSRLSFTHHFNTAQPVQRIGYRDDHVITHVSKPLEVDRDFLQTVGRNETTPPKRTLPRVNRKLITEMGQGDGPHNSSTPMESPMKKLKLDTMQCDETIVANNEVKYLRAEGHVEFRKKSSKKLQPETKWSRPCRLEIAYCGSSCDNCTIYMIIYQGNMKCRRNLLKDFDSCQADD